MHALVVEMTTDPTRIQDVEAHFREDVAPWAGRQSGFVVGHWLRSIDGRTGIGIVVFASEEAANAAAVGPRNFRRDNARAWNIDSVSILEQVASSAAEI